MSIITPHQHSTYLKQMPQLNCITLQPLTNQHNKVHSSLSWFHYRCYFQTYGSTHSEHDTIRWTKDCTTSTHIATCCWLQLRNYCQRQCCRWIGKWCRWCSKILTAYCVWQQCCGHCMVLFDDSNVGKQTVQTVEHCTQNISTDSARQFSHYQDSFKSAEVIQHRYLENSSHLDHQQQRQFTDHRVTLLIRWLSILRLRAQNHTAIMSD